MGKTCKIRSTYVNHEFGEAEVEAEGASLIIKVRTDSDNSFQRGDVAYIIDENKEQGVYIIISETEFNNR